MNKYILKADIEKKEVLGDYLYVQVCGVRDVETDEFVMDRRVLKFHKNIDIPLTKQNYRVDFEDVGSSEIREWLVKREIREYQKSNKSRIRFKSVALDVDTIKAYKEKLGLGEDEGIQEALRAIINIASVRDLQNIYSIYKQKKEDEKKKQEVEGKVDTREYIRRFETNDEALERMMKA